MKPRARFGTGPVNHGAAPLMDQSRDIPDNFERKYASSASVFLEIQGNRANILY